MFAKENGEPQHPNTTYHWLERFCQKNGIPFHGLNSFRHLFCSLLVNQGVDIVTVSGALGHSNVATTVNLQYGHNFKQLIFDNNGLDHIDGQGCFYSQTYGKLWEYLLGCEAIHCLSPNQKRFVFQQI